ncbi:MAG: sulfotransferase [Pseudomonadota bacterium]
MQPGEQLSHKAMFNEALGMITRGELDAAINYCSEVIRRNPSDVSMTALLGAVYLKCRRHNEAETVLRKAIELAPTFAKPHEDLGFLLLEQGRVEEAIKTLETATRLDPKAAGAHYTLGRALAAAGRGKDADAAFENSFALNPQRKLLVLAAEHHKAGRLPQAENMYRQLLKQTPNNVDAMRLLAGVLLQQSMAEEAEDLLRRVVALAPDFALAHMDLATMLKEQDRNGEALASYARVVELEPQRAKPQHLYGAALAQAGRTHEAATAYRAALALQPEHAGALLGLGHTLKTLGDQEDAIQAYRDCIRVRPDNGEIYWSLANLKTYRFSEEDISTMETMVDGDKDISDQSRVNFLFALAKAHEDAGDYDSAWRHYRRGNQEQRELEHYDPVQTELTNDGLVEVFNEKLMQRLSNLGNMDPSPIFVVGLPRSGSTLLEQILASHSQVEGTAELPYLGRVATSLNRNRADGINYPQAVRELKSQHLQALGQYYLDLAEPHRELKRPRFIDKNPNNFPSVGFLKLILPNAKVIDARRYPLDSTLSCYRQLFAKGQTFVYDLQDVGEYYMQYQRMMDHWHKVIPGQVHTVQYEQLVTNFEVEVRKLLEFCELPWEDNCIDFYRTQRPVRTASSEQVRQPVYTRSVHFWRNYEAQLEELIEVLEPILPRYAAFEDINRPE